MPGISCRTWAEAVLILIMPGRERREQIDQPNRSADCLGVLRNAMGGGAPGGGRARQPRSAWAEENLRSHAANEQQFG